MSESQYERLSSLDASFLALETRSTHMHVASISIFDGEGLTDEDGAVDIERIRPFIESRLQYVPRYRQRLAWVPLERHPVWVDDEQFDIEFHVRHSSLPLPGTESQLRQLTGRILSRSSIGRSHSGRCGLWRAWRTGEWPSSPRSTTA